MPVRENFSTCASGGAGAAGAAPPRPPRPPAAGSGAAPRAPAGGAPAGGAPAGGAAAGAAPRPRPPGGAGSRPAAAIQTLPFPSTAMPPVAWGHAYVELGPPNPLRTLPAASYSSTTGAAMQHTLDEGMPGPLAVGAGAIPFSLPSSESLPR